MRKFLIFIIFYLFHHAVAIARTPLDTIPNTAAASSNTPPSNTSRTQNTTPIRQPVPTPAQLRVMIQLSGGFIRVVNENQIDEDSALLLTTLAHGLPRTFSYDEGIDDGTTVPGKSFLDKDDPASATMSLKDLTGPHRIQLLLYLGGYYLFRAGDEKSDMNSALHYLQDARQLSTLDHSAKWLGETMIMLGKYYIKTGNEPQARDYFKQVAENSRQNGDRALEARALSERGIYLSLLNYAHPEGTASFGQALPLFRQLGNKEKEIETLNDIMGVYFLLGNLDSAKAYLLESLALQRRTRFPYIHYSQYVMGYIYGMEGNQTKMLQSALESVDGMEAFRDSAFNDYFYAILGNAYELIDESTKGLFWYRKALTEFQKTPGNHLWYRYVQRIAQLYIQIGKPAEGLDFLTRTIAKYPPVILTEKQSVTLGFAYCYEALREYPQAEKYYLDGIRMEEQLIPLNAGIYASETYARVGEFYVSWHQYKKASFYLHKALSFPPSRISLAGLSGIQLSLYRVDSASGNYQSALQHFTKYKELADSIYNLVTTKQVSALEIQFETAQKEKDIQVLNAQSLVQQKEIQAARLLRNVTFGGIGLLLVIVFLVYNRYRLKQRSHKILEAQRNEIDRKNHSLEELLEEKEWLLKEVHHRVKNNLQIIISLLNTQSSFLDNDIALTAIHQSQQRVFAIALIHQRLYQSKNVSLVNMPDYISGLVKSIQDSSTQGSRISFDLQVEEIELDAAQSVPLGLILNEAICNSIKHAFPGSAAGRIIITMQDLGNDHYLLTIADNGRGLSAGLLNREQESFGMLLIDGLSKQLEGELTIESNNGVKIALIFAKSRIAKFTLAQYAMH